ncbi:MAG TPA: hypothetical protein PKY82_05855 [Pyrinomonadaceae bacterium]|nr:hypothetical protein [Pyrinomonadaceae bacterium]
MKIAVLVVGILGVLLGLIVTVISIALPELTSNKVNFNEALPGIIIGIVILFFSAIIALVGLILVLKKKKQ